MASSSAGIQFCSSINKQSLQKSNQILLL